MQYKTEQITSSIYREWIVLYRYTFLGYPVSKWIEVNRMWKTENQAKTYINKVK